MKAGKFGKTLTDLSDVEGQALVDTLAVTLSELVAKTIGDILTYVEPEAPVETLADTLADAESYTVGNTLIR